MAGKIARRGVSIFIDGSQIPNSVKAIQKEYWKLIRDQREMTIGSEEYIRQTRKIAQLNGLLEEHKATQKEITREYGKMSKSASKFFNSFQVFLGNIYTKGLQLLIMGLGDAVEKIRSFEKANTVLASILGVNKKSVKDLSESAIDLGKNSKYTASQVTELQTELAKLGFSKREIQDSQKYILEFATALDASLSDAATLAGSSLRAFGADTTETQRYVDAMTVAANKSAIGFQYLATAMPTVAPVAKAFNFSIEDTLALLGKLSDSGFDASMAATSLRNILLNLADSNGKLSKALGGPVANLDELVVGFQKLQGEGIDLATALELTDKRSVAAFQTFLQASDGLIELRDSLREAGGEAERVANDQMNNLDGSILSLQSSWEALMLSMSNSSGVLKSTVDGLTWIVDKMILLSNATKDLQETDFYKDMIKDQQKKATVEFELKLRSGVEGKTYDTLEGANKEDFENIVRSNYGIYKEIIQNELSELSKLQEESQKEFDNIIKENETDLGGYGRLIPFYNLGMAKDEREAEKSLNIVIAKVDNAKARINALNEAYDTILKKEDLPNDTTNNKPTPNLKVSEQREKLNNDLANLEVKHQEDMSRIKKSYLNGDIISEEAYNEELLKQQDKYDKVRIEKLQNLLIQMSDPSIRLDIAKRIAEIEAKSLDRQISDKDKKQKDAAKQEQALLKWNQEETKKILDASLKYVATEEDKAYIKQMEFRAQGLISEAEYQKEITNIQNKYLEERLRINGLSEEQIAEIRKELLENEIKTIEDTENKRKSLFGDDIYLQITEQMKTIDDALLSGAVTFGEAVMMRVEALMNAVTTITENIGGNLSNMWTNYQSAEESAATRRYDKEISAAEGNSKKQKKLEEQKQKEINAIRAKYADKQFAVATAMTISSTAVAAMEAYKAMAGIPIVGPALGAIAAGAAIAYGASQIKVAKEQRDAAKEGYFDGGFTGGVDPKEVRGYLSDGSPVHGVEFVANRHLTANPQISPALNLFDEAQKHGTAGSLTKADLAKALNIPMGGYIQGGFTGTPSTSTPTPSNNQYDDSFERFIEVLERLDERLNVPFIGKVAITGDDGLEDAQNLYEKMKKNSSRTN